MRRLFSIRQPLFLNKIVGVDLLRFVGCVRRHTNVEVDHQAYQLWPVNKNYFFGNAR